MKTHVWQFGTSGSKGARTITQFYEASTEFVTVNCNMRVFTHKHPSKFYL